MVQIRRLGEAKQSENLDFRRYLSAHNHRIAELQKLAVEIERQIDCTACANCCRTSVVTVSQSEIEAIARYLGISRDDVVRQYTDSDPDSHLTRVLKSTKHGCMFLDGNLCMIYEARPKTCRDFPHLAVGAHSLGSRVSSLCRWAAACPIIYNAIEGYKRLVGFQGGPRAAGQSE